MDTSIINLVIDNLNKFFYPQEWVALDMAFSKSEIFTMLIVDRHGEIIMSQIAGYINVPMSTATGVVDRLVKNGHLKRERSDSDRRVVVIRLTDIGKEVIDKLRNSIMDYIKLINHSLTDNERQVLYNVFMKIINILNKNNTEEDKDETAVKNIKKIDIE